MTSWIGENADLITLSGEGQPKPEPFRDDRTIDARTPEEKWRFGISFLLRVFGYPIAAFTVLASLLAILSIGVRYYEMSQWTHTQALVDACQITSQKLMKEHGQDPDQYTYGFYCNLTYAAGPQTYRSKANIGYLQSDNSDMVRWSDRIRAGDRISIVYKPSDPVQVRFAEDFSTSYAPALHYLNVIAWSALLSFIFITLGRKLRPASPDTR
jgi:hypothetical protein